MKPLDERLSSLLWLDELRRQHERVNAFLFQQLIAGSLQTGPVSGKRSLAVRAIGHGRRIDTPFHNLDSHLRSRL